MTPFWFNLLPLLHSLTHGGKTTSVSLKRAKRLTILLLKQHSEIRDVLISGGDPLTLSDAALEEILLIAQAHTAC